MTSREQKASSFIRAIKALDNVKKLWVTRDGGMKVLLLNGRRIQTDTHDLTPEQEKVIIGRTYNFPNLVEFYDNKYEKGPFLADLSSPRLKKVTLHFDMVESNIRYLQDKIVVIHTVFRTDDYNLADINRLFPNASSITEDKNYELLTITPGSASKKSSASSKKSSVKKLTCKEGKILNSKTNRCVVIEGKIGREILGKPKKTTICKERKIVNPKTNRCVDIEGKIGKMIVEEMRR